MGQITKAIENSQNVNGYSLKDVIGANRAIAKKLTALREKIFEETGIIITKDNKILVNPQMEHITDIISSEDYKKHPELLRIDLKTDPEVYYDIYTINENNEIIPVHINNSYDKQKNDENLQFIEKYKTILLEYFKVYYECQKEYIYEVKDTDLLIKISGDNVVLYKNGFFINFWDNDKLRIDYYGNHFAEDCMEIFDLNINKVLTGIKIPGQVPDFIKDNIAPASIIIDKPDVQFPNAICYKVIDYSLVSEMISQVNESKAKKQYLANIKNKTI